MAQTDRQSRSWRWCAAAASSPSTSLAGGFAVTPQTVRRDINDLCARDLLRRYHGGAGLPSSVENLAYQARQVLQGPEKKAIAELVARHIPDEASLFINIGTTTEAVARALLGHRRLKVITNNLNVAQILAENESFEIIIAGGVVRNRDGGRDRRGDHGLHPPVPHRFRHHRHQRHRRRRRVLDFDYHEVRVAREIIAGARQVFRRRPHQVQPEPVVRLGSISDVSALFTDRARARVPCAHGRARRAPMSPKRARGRASFRAMLNWRIVNADFRSDREATLVACSPIPAVIESVVLTLATRILMAIPFILSACWPRRWARRTHRERSAAVCNRQVDDRTESGADEPGELRDIANAGMNAISSATTAVVIRAITARTLTPLRVVVFAVGIGREQGQDVDLGDAPASSRP